METENKKSNFLKEHKMGIFVMISTIVILIGLSYAWLQLTLRGEKELNLSAGGLSLVLDDTMDGGIAMASALPITDEEGLSQEGYTFTLENKGTTSSNYTIYLDDLDLLEGQTRMNDGFIKYQLTRDGEEIGYDLLNTTGEDPNRVLDNGSIGSDEKYTYVLKMWIDSSTENEVVGTTFKGQLRVEAIQSVNTTPATETLLEKVNPANLIYTNATNEQQKEMFTFTHTAGIQQSGWSAEELTDYRYIGTNPNNYVTFNNENWRIIGLFTVEDEVGKKEKRLKLIRDDSIGIFSWDNNGENDWSTSALQKLLNSGIYYNRMSGTCPYGENGTTTPCDFSSNGLTKKAKNMIGKAKWYLGGWNTSEITAEEFYGYERGNLVVSGRPTNWIGKVGLMYASDYGYATSRNDLLTTKLNAYSSTCSSTNWFYNTTYYQWTITMRIEPSSYYFFNMNKQGNVSYTNAISTIHNVRPSVYLKSNVSISSGDGSKDNPYQLKI